VFHTAKLHDIGLSLEWLDTRKMVMARYLIFGKAELPAFAEVIESRNAV
jgi:hypothetical protein